MRTRVEPVPTCPTTFMVRWIYILEILSFVLQRSRILKGGTVPQPSNVSCEYAGAAPLQSANENILQILPIFHTSLFPASHLFLLRSVIHLCRFLARCTKTTLTRMLHIIFPTEARHGLVPASYKAPSQPTNLKTAPLGKAVTEKSLKQTVSSPKLGHL